MDVVEAKVKWDIDGNGIALRMTCSFNSFFSLKTKVRNRSHKKYSRFRSGSGQKPSIKNEPRVSLIKNPLF